MQSGLQSQYRNILRSVRTLALNYEHRVRIRIHQLLPHSFSNVDLRESCRVSGPTFGPEVLGHWEGR